ncbi:uncharacterized protein EI97DRAFT_443740 [Westerdykella ornata]|uniref:Uncharacterized protein n=1 Tax=Westerdykella ornata TaxID=318751 RepID=A0A6A6JHY7_WESOR|nr:uncharacterized protein EI97DRAFT_443740 [Westerdykella ornata]KAF2274869.1 hypothetical protein EI97DRAFT_443740 [Westerdykella ornata]
MQGQGRPLLASCVGAIHQNIEDHVVGMQACCKRVRQAVWAWPAMGAGSREQAIYEQREAPTEYTSRHFLLLWRLPSRDTKKKRGTTPNPPPFALKSRLHSISNSFSAGAAAPHHHSSRDPPTSIQRPRPPSRNPLRRNRPPGPSPPGLPPLAGLSLRRALVEPSGASSPAAFDQHKSN